MKKIAIALMVSMFFGFFGFSAVFSGDITTPQAVRTLMESINSYRKQNGLKTLEINQQLMASAQGHSGDMAYNENLTHDSSNGKSFQDRMDDLNIEYSVIVENVAMNAGPDYAKMAFDQWKKSPPHNSNMLKPELSHVGFGFSKSKKGLWYITFDGMNIVEKKQVINVAESTAIACQGQSAQVGLTFDNSKKKSATLVKIKVAYKDGSGWVSVVASMSIPPMTKKIIIASLNAAKLNPGTYTATITAEFGEVTYVKPVKFVVLKIVCKLTAPTSQITATGKSGYTNNFLVTITNLSECQANSINSVVSSNVNLKVSLDKTSCALQKNGAQSVKVTFRFTKDLPNGTKIDITFTAVVAGVKYTAKRTVVVKR